MHNKTNKNLLCRYKEDFVFESNLEVVHGLLQTVSDPISFMADALDVENDDGIAIDFTLEKLFKSNRPPNFHLLKDKETELSFYSSGRTQLESRATCFYCTILVFILMSCFLLGSFCNNKHNCLTHRSDSPFPKHLVLKNVKSFSFSGSFTF